MYSLIGFCVFCMKSSWYGQFGFCVFCRGPQQVPDTSQLDPSTQHGDFLLFHSDPHHEESLRSRTKSKRAELSSEPSCSYSTYEGREEYSPVPSVERPPSLLQADLLSGEGGAYVEAETEWLVPSLDQPREHQQQLPVPVAQVVS